MSFIIVGLVLLVAVYSLVAWGIVHFKTKTKVYFHNFAWDPIFLTAPGVLTLADGSTLPFDTIHVSRLVEDK